MQDILFGGSQFNRAAKKIQINSLSSQLVDEFFKRQVAANRIKYQYQASVKVAKLHQQAVKFGADPSNPSNATQRILCACCNKQVSHDSLGICFSTTDISELQFDQYAKFPMNSGIAMLFSFIKMLIVYFLLRGIVIDGFNLATNLMFGTVCVQDQNCEKVFWNYLATPNKANRQDLFFVLDIVNLVFVIMSIIFFFYYRRSQYHLYDNIDGKTQTQDDYTIMVSNIPVLDFPKTNEQNEVEFFHRKHLWEFFEQKVFSWLNEHKNWEKPSHGTVQYHLNSLKHDQNNGELRSSDIVKSISLCYDLSRIQRINEERQKLIDQFLDNNCQQLDDEQQKYTGRFSTTPKKVDFLNECEITVNQEFATNNSVLFNMTHFIGHAFVSFEYQHFREYILQQAQRDKNFLKYSGSLLRVSKASHPNDIFWQNLRISHQARKGRIFITVFILSMMLLFSLLLITILESFKEKLSNLFNSSGQSQQLDFLKIVSTNWPMVLIAVSILVINQFLNRAIHSLTNFEKHETKTDESISLIIKLVIFEFFNTALIYYFVQLIKDDDKYVERTGLIIQVSWLIIFNIFSILLFRIINFGALFKSFSKCWKYRNLQDQDTVKTFQIRLNRQFQYPQFDIVEVYSQLIVHVYTVSFYAFLLPIGPLSCIIYFSFYFWVIKCNLFKRSSLYYSFNFTLSRSVLKMFQVSILIFSIGNFLLAFQQQKIELVNLILKFVSLGIALIYILFIFLAPQGLQRKILGRYQTYQKPTYDDAKGGGCFQQTYWTQNPATRLIKQETITKKVGIVNPLKQIVFANPQTLLLEE